MREGGRHWTRLNDVVQAGQRSVIETKAESGIVSFNRKAGFYDPRMARSPEPDPMRGVLRWAWAKTGQYLGSYWVGVLVIGVASVFVSNTLALPANPTPLQRIENGLIGVLIAAGIVLVLVYGYSLLIAPFQQRNALRLTIKTERQASATEINALRAERDAPNFYGRIEQTASGHHDGITAVLLTVSIVNRGAPSVVRYIAGYVTVAGTRKPMTNLFVGDNTKWITKQGTIVLQRQDALYEKATMRIDTGAMVSGWLLFDVEGENEEEIHQAGNSVEVVFEDVLGKEYVAAHVFRGGGDPIRYYPGSGGVIEP